MSDFIHFEVETADETNEEEEPMSIDANDFTKRMTNLVFIGFTIKQEILLK